MLKCHNKFDLERFASLLKGGAIAVFPTDTVYGIGCDPYNNESVSRLFKIKRRDPHKPVPILVADAEVAESIMLLGDCGKVLANCFWPGALTIVGILRDTQIAPAVTAGNNTVAIRIPDNKCVLSFLALSERKCIIGTSANLSGERPIKKAEEFIDSGLKDVDVFINDDGIERESRESTIVDITGEEPRIIRQGAIKSQDIYQALKSKYTER
jgi:L-threonylcarbamoyladenylate synthase